MRHKKITEKKNYAFIDSQNLYLGIRDQGWRLDYARFRKYLEDKHDVVRAFLFIGYISTKEALYTSLQKQGYIVIFKPTLRLRDGKVKGNADTELVMHAMIELPNYEKAVIVAGDGDYHCLVEHLDKIDKLQKLFIPNQKKYSSLYRHFVGRYAVFMNSLRGKLEYTESKKKRGITSGRNPSDVLSS